MSLVLQMCRCCAALTGVVALVSGAMAAESKPNPTVSQPAAQSSRQPTHMRTTVTLPNGLTISCVVPLPPEPATAQLANKRYVPPPDPIPPCLTPEQREAHEKANAALQRLRDSYNSASPRKVQASKNNSNQSNRKHVVPVQPSNASSPTAAALIQGYPEPLGSAMAYQAVPVPTAFMVPRIPDGHTGVPTPSPDLRHTSGPATNLPPNVQAAYDAANQLTQFNSGTPNVTHDANGNLTSITDLTGTTTFTYDARNRLIARNGPDINETYTYDALGRRVTKTTNGETKSYLHDGNDIVAEVQGSAVSATYLRSLNIDEPFVRQSASGSEFYHADAQGSALSLTDTAGMVRTSYSYDAYGNTSITGIVSTNPFQYTGRENDGLGLYYYRARYYSPIIHRFFNEDPSGFGGGDINFFSYVSNNPINLSDPSGLVIAPGPVPPGCEPPLDKREKYFDRFTGEFLCSLNFLPELGTINFTGKAAAHIAKRHLPEGAKSAGRSTFGQGENIPDLVRRAESVPPVPHPNGNFERIVDAGRTIGTDRNTGQPTSTYTVITDAAGDLVTAFPGRPGKKP